MKRDDSEQRLIQAVLLSLAVYFLWASFYGPQPTPPPVDTTVPQAAVIGEDPVGAAPEIPAITEAPIAVTETLPRRSQKFSTSAISSVLSSEGGGMAEISLPQHEAPYDITPLWSWFFDKVRGKGEGPWLPYGTDPGVQSLISPDGVLLAAGAGRDLLDGRYRLDGSDTATRVTPDGLSISKTYRPTDDPRVVEVDVRFTNTSGSVWSEPLWVGATDVFAGEVNRYSNVARPVLASAGKLKTLDDLEDAALTPEVYETPVSWFGIADRYFIAAAIPENPSWGKAWFSANASGLAGSYVVNDAVNLAPGATESLRLSVYVGSKDLQQLKEIGHDLPVAVDLGFFGFFARILLWVLQAFQALVGNWGVAIILLTLLAKLSFWPLTQKSFKSSRQMQQLGPKMQELRDRYKDDAQKLGEEQMKLFKDEGVNPLSGCLPMLIQMPVWFALYSVLLFTADVYHARFLYLKDLSSPDPYGLLPVVVGILMLLQQRIMPMSPQMDPTQQKLMRAMPLIFVVFLFSFPSGLAVYITVNTLLSILQLWVVNRAHPVVTAPAPAK